MITFQAKLYQPDAPGTWTYVECPISVEEKFGIKGRVPVKGEINGVPFRSSLMAQGNERHILVVNGDIRKEIGSTAGDLITVWLEKDEGLREVAIPDDFNSALQVQEQARNHFDQMSYSRRKEYVDWIEGAKKAETRSSRIMKAVERLTEGLSLK
ncbi:Bacteriocin-protection, YdeI or OmpD-Associated [Paenibacillus sp. yr247]|uniref:YdeI/OmpD-associated family protein n=1 Tax=Paenibacillus sp. yr247 TaxID=1761880 RepID=UPI0008873F14|nr:YdeI/OmpD-associated family protein [Paenibacillus sp. yr247]SDN03066.1 Bacteriocin-protection, YdeI or OmpD-Associated [Paenibacillus sp. yr247]